MKCNPCYWPNLLTLIIILPDRNGIIYNFLNLIYQYYKKAKKWYTNLKIFYKKSSKNKNYLPCLIVNNIYKKIKENCFNQKLI